ncbi:MAG: Lrp/AsnC family transcriptional regulator [Dehalococcoidia bacterium]|nr:Lrp/AsnC family transcriptional regulator [Dehalococcoidia bacterium]
MSEKTAKKPLDELDRMIISELEVDARRSAKELAAKLGTSHTTVQRRLRYLLDEGIISFVTIADHKTLGYLTLVLLGINIRPGKVDAVATRIASLDYSKMVSATLGHYDLLVSMSIEGLEDLGGFVSTDLGAIKEITNIDSMIILEIFKNDWSCLVANGHIIQRHPGKNHLDEFEKALIGELELHPRETISELAQKLRTNRLTVSKRLQALLEKGIIRIVSVPDLSALGYKIWITVKLKVDPSQIHEVAQTLCGYPNVTQVIMLTGMYELGIAAVFKDRTEVYDFMENQLGQIPGVIGHEALMNLKSYKRAFGLPPLRGQHIVNSKSLTCPV